MKPILQLSNPELLDHVKRLARCERESTADLIIHLAEVERRELHHAEGFSSMFSYCTRVLSLSEDAAILRLRAMRAVRRRPEILADLTSGALNLSTIRVLEPYLTSANATALLASARHKGKREVEKLVRGHDPLPDVADMVRKLPSLRMQTVAAAPSEGATNAAALLEGSPVAVAPTSDRGRDLAAPQCTTDVPVAALQSETAASAAPPLHEGGAASEVHASPHPRVSVIAPLGPARYKVQFMASEELHAKLLRARELLRHRIPSGDLAQVMDLALDALLEKLEKQSSLRRPARGVKPCRDDLPSQRRPGCRSRPRRTVHPRGRFQRRSNARSGSETAAGVHSSVRADARAGKVASWSSIIVCRSRLGAKRRWRTSRYGAGPTISTRRGSTSGRT